jgi:type II secretory pathway pseudopilin PulG
MRRGSAQQSGFTILAVLLAMVLMALAAEGVMQVASQQDRRQRDQLLHHIGATYARAIGTYYEGSPGSIKQWPRSLDELTDDRRFVTTRRHIRELYADPVTRSATWGLVRAEDGGIKGVYSLAEGKPLVTAPVERQSTDRKLPAAYADLQFVYTPKTGPTP